MLANLLQCIDQLCASCHMSQEEAHERRALLGITQEASAENVMLVQREIHFLNSRIPILLLINARDHLLLLSRQLENDRSAVALQAQLQDELHNVGSRLHKALVSWELAHSQAFTVNDVRVLDVLLTDAPPPPQVDTRYHTPQASHVPAARSNHSTAARQRPDSAPRTHQSTKPNTPSSSGSRPRSYWRHVDDTPPIERRNIAHTRRSTPTVSSTKRKTSLSAYKTPQQQHSAAKRSHRVVPATAKQHNKPPRSNARYSTPQHTAQARAHSAHKVERSVRRDDRWSNSSQTQRPHTATQLTSEPRYYGEQLESEPRYYKSGNTPTKQVGDQGTAYMSPAEIEARIQATLYKYGL
eukprot:TRINITY_DN44824_c0_g1_i2.p1 TRINITY_DN44824_c0_g1~~TRINITY_DN44824_c0_g1_i2.p1  ORF type:complete len:354 (+),score=67.00 TRINITY_DN44824_c0_g1_i2:487-1548(+)